MSTVIGMMGSVVMALAIRRVPPGPAPPPEAVPLLVSDPLEQLLIVQASATAPATAATLVRKYM
ncbi:MAG: hypothetical protein L0H96_02565 [Humibacillus sp.]|nr:hypothetical protein [Humibacillus sp.]